MDLESLTPPPLRHITAKRSKRSPPADYNKNSVDDDNLAACLVMLARGTAASASASATNKQQQESVQKNIINSFTCGVCGKSFPSHQALGGHKSSHRVKTLPSVANGKPTTAVKNSEKPHECSICHMIYPTGQALGGHKRKHYEGTIGGGTAHKSDAMTASDHSGVTTFDGGASSYSHDGDVARVVPRNFDLNLPPTADDTELLDLALGFV